MTEQIKKTLRDSKTARWAALGIISFTMLTGYFLADVMAPLKPLLEEQLLWTSTEYGLFTSAYGWFNVFLLMLILGGIILDKMGVRFTGLGAATIMVVGTAIKYWAISTTFPEGATILGIKSQIAFAAFGYAIFGVGVEIAGITVAKIIVKWFKGKELALAMGLEMSTARMGTLLAMAVPVPIANHFHDVSAPILLCLIMLVIGLISFFIYTFMDKKLEASNAGIDDEDEEAFRLSDIGLIVKNKGFWYIAILCVLFYSAVFPYLKYAADLMVNKYGVDPEFAGLIPSLLPLGTLFMTPFFGNLYDRKGKGATIMIIGSIMLIFVHAVFAIPGLDNYLIAIVLVIILGIAFSLVPSAMWPSVPKIIPEKQLGTAYALIFWVQNWGLMGVPLLIGWVLDKYCITSEEFIDGGKIVHYDYTLPMIIFTGFGILALIFAFLLKAEDKKKGYGLELPNIQR
ncbi:MAG: MFS transporter [Candidatus Marinimicrobia bacterium]|nr:MFS transporter [bacterium]MCG2715756.1 MFS transporter [Candidatus Neomarinimicrobiota bacterium]